MRWAFLFARNVLNGAFFGFLLVVAFFAGVDLVALAEFI